MGPDTLGPVIPILALSIPIIAIRTRHRTKIAGMQINAAAGLSAEKAAQYAPHPRELEQRVQVLERIATENHTDLALQIENLRGVKAN
jgi:hypothetical protein